MTEYDQPDSGGSDKLAISLPKGAKALLQAHVDAGRASSVSALIAEAVKPLLATEADRQDTLRRIAELREGRPISPEALAWARQALGVDQSSAGQGAA